MKERIESYLEREGLIVIGSNGKHQIVTRHLIGEITFDILGIIDNTTRFPLGLPRFLLLNRSKFGHLAHVSWNTNDDPDTGIICTGVTDSQFIAYEVPELVFASSLKDAVNTVSRGLLEPEYNKQEIIEEFSANWGYYVQNYNSENKCVLSFAEPNKLYPVHHISVEIHDQVIITSRFELSNSNYEFRDYYSNKPKEKHHGCLIIFNDPFLPPYRDLCLLEWWKQVIKNLSDNELDVISKSLRKEKYKHFWILGGIPISEMNLAWFAIKFASNSELLPPVKENWIKKSWQPTPYLVETHQKGYLLPRGGATSKSDKTHIAVIGCGSVGAEIARLLAHSGVGKLDFIDPDIFNIDNTYRHVLSPIYYHKYKKNALCDMLMSQFPYITCEAPKKFLSECEIEEFLLKYDGLVIATGSPTDERHFNNYVMSLSKRPWCIYSWVEGHGVGGHGVYVHTEGKGCLSCLYRDGETGESSFKSIQNFLEIDQPFAVSLAGCGQHFLPYSYTDAVQTAIITVRLAIKALSSELAESCKMSWKGEQPEELKTTHRFQALNKSMFTAPLSWDGCEVCQNAN